MTASNFRPLCFSISRAARVMVWLSVRRSWPTSGAPMLATTPTQSVIVEVGRRHQMHATAFLVEGPHVEQGQVRAAAAAGAQHPGADGQRLDIVGRELTKTHANTLLNSMS